MHAFLYLFLVLYSLLATIPVAGQVKDWIRMDNIKTTEGADDIKKANELRIRQPDSARRWLLQLLKQHWIHQDQKEIRRCLVALSYFYKDPAVHEQSLLFAQRGLQLCDTQQHRKELSILYENIGQIYFRQSRYEESFKMRLKAIGFANADPLRVAGIEYNMIETLLLLGYKNLALEYLERCLSTAISYQNGRLWANALLSISRIKEQYENQHFPYWDSSVQVARKFKLYSALYVAILNKSSALANNGKPQQALLLLKTLDTLAPYHPVSPDHLWKAEEIAATAYAALGQYKTAEQLFMQSLGAADPHGWLSNMNQLTNMYLQQGDFKKAFYTSRTLQSRIDSIGSHDMRLRLIATELQYKNAEKDKELAKNKLALVEQKAAIKSKNTWIGIMASSALVLLAIILLLRRNYQQKQSIQRSEQINLQLKARIDGEELERERLSRELHDGIGGLLSAAKMNLTTLRPPAAREESLKYERSVQLMDDAYTELRRTAHNMSPAILKSKGLVETVALFCQKTEEAHRIAIKFQHFGVPDTLSDEIALSVYRMIQELIQNIVKHSGAQKAMVQLSGQDNGLQIIVEDRGKGIAQQDKIEGIGLNNIKNRVMALGGRLDIDSRVNEGTAVYINIDNAYT